MSLLTANVGKADQVVFIHAFHHGPHCRSLGVDKLVRTLWWLRTPQPGQVFLGEGFILVEAQTNSPAYLRQVRIIEEQRTGNCRHAAYILLRSLLGQQPSRNAHFLGMLAHQLNRI
ncbi:hypothetical protein BV341_05677 [Pseudomonas syringae pv. actinidiae]|nr:hypothetical protein BV340_05558 [Pseudomonas syringae pv. actinidiae]OSN12174.1 hypothetical protein BV339_05530 [Pseudomonas syringae pv. actinidiae]OSN12906.1 hypothetical protein BV341_05677 [Pseudomonas syringae pv. actinidiae]OSN26600.1 hypothetical protein BV343_05504 [Pseudomonas syringae pv. actinidiae]OSN27482.1 hypothetical protein BV342_05690 [Pseudomonas syringae pv. actinidiae]